MHPSVSSWPVFVQIVNLPYVVVKATFLICLRFVVRNFLSLNAFLLWGLLQQHIWCSKYRHRRDLQCFPHYLKTNRLKTRSPNSKPKLSFLGLSSMEQYSQFQERKIVSIFKSKAIMKLDDIIQQLLKVNSEFYFFINHVKLYVLVKFCLLFLIAIINLVPVTFFSRTGFIDSSVKPPFHSILNYFL